MSEQSLHGNDFLVVHKGTMVPAFEVLRHVQNYSRITGTSGSIPGHGNMEVSDDHKYYQEYVERRRPYLPDLEAQLPDHIRKFYSQITDGLVGPDWTLLSIDPCFASARNAILRELTQIGLTEGGWYYVVDNLPTDSTQLRGALLVIMPEKLKTVEWKSASGAKLSRIIELVARLKFLMDLSGGDAGERREVLVQLVDRLKMLAVNDIGNPTIDKSSISRLSERHETVLPLAKVSCNIGSERAEESLRSNCGNSSIFPAETEHPAETSAETPLPRFSQLIYDLSNYTVPNMNMGSDLSFDSIEDLEADAVTKGASKVTEVTMVAKTRPAPYVAEPETSSAPSISDTGFSCASKVTVKTRQKQLKKPGKGDSVADDLENSTTVQSLETRRTRGDSSKGQSSGGMRTKKTVIKIPLVLPAAGRKKRGRPPKK